MEIRWQGNVDIAAPIEQVYAYLADFPRHTEWGQTRESVKLSRPGGPDGVGAEYESIERQAFQSDRAPKGDFPAKAKKESRRNAWSSSYGRTSGSPGKDIQLRSHSELRATSHSNSARMRAAAPR
jgi:hypothetical protein